jgi:hypothetical protein
MILQLESQHHAKQKAVALVDEIFSKQKFLFKEKNTPKTVGEYYLKYLAKNGKYSKTRKSNLPV